MASCGVLPARARSRHVARPVPPVVAQAAAAEANNGELPAKEDKVTLHRSIGRKAPVKYCVTGGWVGGVGRCRSVGKRHSL